MNLSCRRPDPARSASVPIHFSALAARLLNRALLVLVAAITSGAGAGVAAQSAQAPGRVVVREVVRGETLIGIAHDMLDPQHSWQALAAFNELNKADRIRPGERLRVPAAWLKPLAVEAKVVSMSGDVREGGRQLKSGDVLSEGQALETGPDAVVTVELPDGSRLRIAPASAVRLDRLRRYHDEKTIDALIRLERGRVEAVAQPGRTRPFLIRSPHATAAVRGTQFRVGALDSLATTEVLTGAVAWSGADAAAGVAAGFGSTADPKGKVSEPRALLPAPDLSPLGRTVETIGFRIAFAPVPGAAAYRVEVAADERFERPLLQTVVTEPQVSMDSRNDGVHFARVRAIDPNRLEGYEAQGQIMVRARPVAPQPGPRAQGEIHFGTAAMLDWQPVTGVQAYRVQLAGADDFAAIVLERQVTSTETEVLASEAGEGVRYWRVASVDAAGRAGPFGVPRRLEWRGVPRPPAVATDGERIELHWPVPPGHDSRIEVRWQGPAGELVRHHVVSSTAAGRSVSLVIDGLPPGAASATLTLTAPDRVATPPSAPASWVVPDPLRSSDGRPVTLGSGGLVGAQGR